MTQHSIRLPVGLSKRAMKSKARRISVMTHLKRGVVEVKAKETFLAHAKIIAIAKAKCEP